MYDDENVASLRCSAFQIVSNSSRLTLDFLLKVTSSTTSRTTQAVEIDRLLFTSDEEDNESSGRHAV